MSERKLNHEAWARSMIGFIRERGLESEFQGWCGGWPCRVASPDEPPPSLHREPVKAEAVAWRYDHADEAPIFQTERRSYVPKGWTETPLYATPQPTEAQRIVAWLRERQEVHRSKWGVSIDTATRDIADAIEAGEHLAGEGQ
jgi:hypothetical protein